MHDDIIPPTEAELAAEGDAFVKWARGMPKPVPKRARQLAMPPLTQADIAAHVAAAIAEHTTFMHDVMAQVVGEIQQRFNRKLEILKSDVAQLRTELQIEKQVNARMSQVEQRQQREQRHAVNGHA